MLTKLDILSMDSFTAVAEVSKALGWRWYSAEVSGITFYRYGNGSLGWDVSAPPSDPVEREEKIKSVLWHKPSWWNSLDESMELVKFAEKKLVGFALHNIYRFDLSPITYEAVFYDPWGGPKAREYRAESSIPSQAVCQAFLLYIKDIR